MPWSEYQVLVQLMENTNAEVERRRKQRASRRRR